MKTPIPQRSLSLKGWSLLALLALIWGGSFTANHAALAEWPPGPHALSALLYLVVMASAVAYRLFYTVLQQAGAGNLGLVTLLIAPVAVLLGAALFDETLPPQAFAGLALLTLGLVILDGRPLHWIAARLSR